MARYRRRNRTQHEEAKLEMTPMIDVVFQLLVFFIFTLKPQDIIAELNVNRPAPDSRPPPKDQPQDLVSITIGPRVIDVNGVVYSMARLERKLQRLASFSKTQSILIKCTLDSRHEKLVGVLDVCAKAGLTNLSVFTL